MSEIVNTESNHGNRPHVLIVGVGSIGERHVRCFQGTGACEVSICESNDSLRAQIVDRYGCEGFNGVDQALEARVFDAAVICTPAPSHIALALQCVRAGLHVLIEKPLSTGTDGIGELAEAAESGNRQIRVAYVYRFMEAVQRVKQVIDGGCCGEVRHITVCAGQHFPSFRPAYRSIYYAKHESGGGAIQDALTHLIHAVEWLVAPVEKIFAHASRQVLDGVDVEDTVNASARLAGGALVSFALNQFQAPNEITFSFHGANGSLMLELPGNRIGVMAHGAKEWSWEQLPVRDVDVVFIAQARDFLSAITGDPGSGCTLSEGLQTLRCNLAALQSADSRKEESIS